MAITRKLKEILLSFDGTNTPTVTVTGIISDSDEGTATGAAKVMQAQAVLDAAATLRDACMTVAANAGKPLTF